jgi:cytidylate kinase
MTAKKDNVLKKWTQPDQLDLLSEWAGYGYTDNDIAGRMGISIRSFYRYRSQSPEIDYAIQEGKEIIDFKVESALLKAALGYETKETKVTLMLEGKKVVREIRETTTKEHPPNVLACQTWLFNRQRDKWKRNRDADITIDDEDKTINITIQRAGQSEPQC